jgi:hypothetical protein
MFRITFGNLLAAQRGMKKQDLRRQAADLLILRAL